MGPKRKGPETLLVDSDALIALLKADDSQHAKAVGHFAKLQQGGAYRLVASCFVIAEVATVLSLRVGHAAAVAFIDTVQRPDSDLPVIYPDAANQALAASIFRRQTSKNVSFVDCGNMALLQANGWDRIFSYDAIYKKNGFRLFS